MCIDGIMSTVDSISIFFLLFFNFILYWIYNVLLVSHVQQSDLVIHIHIYKLHKNYRIKSVI